MFFVGPEDGRVALCLDCTMKLQALQREQLDDNERMINYLADQLEMVAGIPGLAPRFPPRQHPIAIHTGDPRSWSGK